MTKSFRDPNWLLWSLDERTLHEKAEKCVVFAKLKSLQKQEIVQILNRNGTASDFSAMGSTTPLHSAPLMSVFR